MAIYFKRVWYISQNVDEFFIQRNKTTSQNREYILAKSIISYKKSYGKSWLLDDCKLNMQSCNQGKTY